MKKYLGLFVICFSALCAQAQKEIENRDAPIVIEELSDKESLKNLLGFDGFLFKDDRNNPNTSEFLNYGLNLRQVEKDYPYLIKKGPEGKYIAYEQLVPILIQALEETSEQINEEKALRMKLEENYSNYQITMENHLQQINYNLQLLKGEMEGLNETKSSD
ncbi:MAG: hypothetical protein ACJAVL_000081 [Bacteroidia bacterium]|jgi:hypothetical protein